MSFKQSMWMEQAEYTETSGNHPKEKNTTFTARRKFEMKKAKVVGSRTAENCVWKLALL
jgi:hypothetical protein